MANHTTQHSGDVRLFSGAYDLLERGLVVMKQSDDFGRVGGHEVEVIFSLVDGSVWASWPGAPARVRLGEYQGVASMMRDFLAQCEIAERLLDHNSSDSGWRSISQSSPESS